MPNLNETELARLEELACAAGVGDYSAHDDADASAKFAAAACNAVPALVAEVRMLREALNKEHRAWQCADARGDWLEMENAALREKVDALEWFVEVHKFGLSLMYDDISNDAAGELLATTYAAREAVNAEPE